MINFEIMNYWTIYIYEIFFSLHWWTNFLVFCTKLDFFMIFDFELSGGPYGPWTAFQSLISFCLVFHSSWRTSCLDLSLFAFLLISSFGFSWAAADRACVFLVFLMFAFFLGTSTWKSRSCTQVVSSKCSSWQDASVAVCGQFTLAKIREKIHFYSRLLHCPSRIVGQLLSLKASCWGVREVERGNKEGKWNWKMCREMERKHVFCGNSKKD